MDTTVLVLQHAEKTSSPGDPSLTERGLWQAERAAVALRQLRPAALVSSPLLRARQTARAVAAACSLEVIVDERLRERMDWVPGQDGAAFVEAWRRSSTERDWVPASGRSSRQAGGDALSAVTAHAVNDRAVVLVSHGGTTVDLLRDLLGDVRLEGVAPGLIADGVPGAALTELRRTEVGWWPTRIAQVDHLEAGEQSTHTAL